MKKLLMIIALTGIATGAFAAHTSDVEKAIPLKDGSTVHIFRDGKMAMENKYGNAVRMKEGEVMVAEDGRKIVMRGDEVARLHSILYEHWQ